MALVIEQNVDAVAEASSSFTMTYPVTPTEGSLLLGIVAKRFFSQAISSGWTLLNRVGQGSPSGDHQAGVWYKVAGASEPTAHSWTGSSSGKWAGGMLEISGQDGVPIDSYELTQGTDTGPGTPSLTISDNGTLVIAGTTCSNITTLGLDAALAGLWSKQTSGGSALMNYGGQATASSGTMAALAHTLSSAQPWIAFAVAVKPLAAAAGPVYDNDPTGSLGNKVGDTVNVDANAWFTSSGGVLNWGDGTTGITLPAGLSLAPGLADAGGGIITGTLTESPAAFACTVQCSDDNGGPTPGNFTWDIEAYKIVFAAADNTRLEDSNGAAITTNGLSVSVIEGTYDAVTGTPIQVGTGISVTGGEYTITLPEAENSSKSYVVLFEDTDETNLPLATYERSSI